MAKLNNTLANLSLCFEPLIEQYSTIYWAINRSLFDQWGLETKNNVQH